MVFEPHPTWKNTHADVYATFNPRTISVFFENVVRPAICKLQQNVEIFGASSDPVDAFRQRDAEDLIVETLKAFCLSLNSIWERQLRTFMAHVAGELYDDPSLIKKCQIQRWDMLDGLFEDLRGFKLSYFRAYDDLDTLQLLANVCRHGDGPSLKRLSSKCPELWAEPGPTMPSMTEGNTLEQFRTDNLVISLELLEHLSGAIQSFWNQSQYIYLESIDQKHEGVLKKLEVLRPVWHT